MLLGAVSAHATGQIPIATAQYREVEQTYSVEGLVEATRQSTVSAQISGRIKEINFDVGDRVKKGQVILRIDERETAQALAGSNAQVLQAQATLQNAKANYERSRQLFAQKFISQSALDTAQSEYQVARAQAAASEAGAGQAGLAHAYSVVVAPYSGVVAARLVEVGEMVTPGKPMMAGFDPEGMRVVVSVPQYKLSEIGSRPRAMVEAPSLNRWIKAVSATVQPLADARTHSTQVRVYLPANEAGVYPGMFVRAHFVVGKANKLVIPGSAVLHRGEVVAVYVADEKGAVRLRQVRLGEMTADGSVEVLAGLNPGEQVALDPVKAGMKQNQD
ncbi:MAG: efflux transporter periplasmic adaptor subunit [Betaproteobacteria bacterium RBG_16_56_24]|nr:MAG: efflux transporter periplasmic adaptor subunit [Betaproteobacteria bacterium RBG_16_56_24]